MSDYISKDYAIQQVEGLTKKQRTNANINCILVNAGEVIDCLHEQPSLDEKEIIRKAFERIVERLEESKKELQNEYLGSAFYRMAELNRVIKIVKEEGGIE